MEPSVDSIRFRKFGGQRGRVRHISAKRLLAGIAVAAPVLGKSESNDATCSPGASGDDSGSCSAATGQDFSLWTLEKGGLSVSLARTTNGSIAWKEVRWVTAEGGTDNQEPCEKLHLGPLFEVAFKNHRQVVDSNSCQIAGHVPVNASAQSLAVHFQCPFNLSVHWVLSLNSVLLPGEKNFDEEVVAGAAARIVVHLSGTAKAAPSRLTMLSITQEGSCHGRRAGVVATGEVDGSPVLAQRRFFLALEHPLAKNNVNATTLPPNRLLDAGVAHLATRTWNAKASSSSKSGGKAASLSVFRYTAVIGAFAEEWQARRVFLAYLSSQRLATSWKGPLVHYNSWYDFHSWQDEGFFGPRRGRTVEEAKEFKKLLRQMRKDQMHEQSAIQVIQAYGEELVRKRGAVMDSFLWDDGWDDSEEDLWAFDRERFPNGFGPVAQVAKNYSCGNGVWLSPWGGYGTAKDNRVATANDQGFETNKHGLALSGPKYFERFKKAAVYFRREAGVNFFKFDGVAGEPDEVAAEIEAMLGISAELHTTGDGDVWINLTTGTWPSPFFLLWVDSIWRGHTDTKLVDERALPGASIRQRWHAFRECIVYHFIAQRANFFPIARLMIHGVVLAQHGDARSHGLHAASELDWNQEVWSFASMGLLLQELYVSPELMSGPRWDVLAEALAWVRSNSLILEDMRWAFPAGCADGSFPPHGWAAWRGNVGFLTLRNLKVSNADASPEFSLAEAFELPLAAQRSDDGSRRFEVTVVKRFANKEVDGDDSCSYLSGSEPLGNGSCSLYSLERTRIMLGHGELLILKVLML